MKILKQNDIIFETKNLTKAFILSNGERLTACDDISLTLHSGETLAIVGESGCGKSTLAKMLMQLIPATKGEVWFQGKEITHLRGEALRQMRRHIQLVFQDAATALPPRQRVWEMVTEPLYNFGLLPRHERRAKAAVLLQMMALSSELGERFVHELSGGQRQRVALVRALSLQPKVLICDEATSALDMCTQSAVIQQLLEIQRTQGLSILFICHDLALAQQVANRVAVLYQGKIVEVLSAKQMLWKAQHPYTKTLLQAALHLQI